MDGNHHSLEQGVSGCVDRTDARGIQPSPIPVAAALELRGQVEAWVNEGGSWIHGGSRPAVLIIEDEVIIGMLLARLLVGLGHEVIGVEGSEEGAVALAALRRPGLILVDERLRAGSGQAALEQILRDGFIPHIWMSGNAVPGTRLGHGVAAIRKPFTLRELEAAIAQVFRPVPPEQAAMGMRNAETP